MGAHKLLDVLSYLHERTPDDFKGKAVDDYLTWARFDPDDFIPFTFFREDTYGRNLVYKDDNFEMLVITWLPKQRTPIHNHAGQRCWMSVLSGELVLKNFAPLNEKNPALVPRGDCETHRAGDAIYIDDGIGIHSIANASPLPAVSLHVYAAPIRECTIYDEKTRRFVPFPTTYFTEFGAEWEKALQAVRASSVT